MIPPHNHRLAFIATLIYASVIFHRDRKGLYSESRARLPYTDLDTATDDVERASLSPETRSELPTSTPYHPLVQQEVMELGELEERIVASRPASAYRELAGEEQGVYELAAERSVRGARTP